MSYIDDIKNVVFQLDDSSADIDRLEEINYIIDQSIREINSRFKGDFLAISVSGTEDSFSITYTPIGNVTRQEALNYAFNASDDICWEEPGVRELSHEEFDKYVRMAKASQIYDTMNQYGVKKLYDQNTLQAVKSIKEYLEKDLGLQRFEYVCMVDPHIPMDHSLDIENQ